MSGIMDGHTTWQDGDMVNHRGTLACTCVRILDDGTQNPVAQGVGEIGEMGETRETRENHWRPGGPLSGCGQRHAAFTPSSSTQLGGGLLRAVYSVFHGTGDPW